MLVVGFTGVINTWADLVIKVWQFGQLAEMTSQYADRPVVTQPTSLTGCGRNRTASATGYETGLRGLSRLHLQQQKPLRRPHARQHAVDRDVVETRAHRCATGKLTDTRNMPWYVVALLISQPLHFGDYGGMPLKIIWAVLDIITIVVLITGLYLWLRRRESGSSVERMLAATQAASNDPVLIS
jgi:uncharacterized iron-regulated membrane protein